MSTLSPQPYKGTRDYYPEEKRVQNYIFAVWRRTVERHGYQEYGAPMLEPLEVYTAKSGQELASEQTYAFTDRGDRMVAIRPEMTPSISRMVAARRQELGYPARLYSIANFMRYERPQRGREREFWQLNTDIFGVDGVRAEAEIIGLADEILKAFGAKDTMYKIKVNNRQLIDFCMSNYLKLDGVQSQLMIKLLDRKDKISTDEFVKQAHDIFGDRAAEEGRKKLAKLLTVHSVDELPQEIAESQPAGDLRELFRILNERGVKTAVFDAALMRGLDYYTGTVFEAFDMHPDNNRSMFGGGRYDGLVGLFGVEPIATVGMAPGLTTTELFLRSHELLPELTPATEVGIVVINNNFDAAEAVARELRVEGVAAEVDISGRKLDKQIKAYVKKDVPYMVFVGEDEREKALYPFKNVKTTDEETIALERIITLVKDRRTQGKKDDLAEFFD